MKHFKKLKGFVLGVLTTVLVYALINTAFAAGDLFTRNISAYYPGIHLIIDGKKVTPKDANGNSVEPFIYNDTTYLPVRAVANALDKDVSWDNNTNTIYINSKSNNNSNVGTISNSGETLEVNTISDSLLDTLSTNWLTGNSAGSWASDAAQMYLGVGGGYGKNGYLPFNTDKYETPSKYSVQATLNISNENDCGGFYFNWDKKGDNCSYGVGINSNGVYIVHLTYDRMYSYYASNEIVKSFNYQLQENNDYCLKVNVNGSNLDIYLDNKYVSSYSIPDDANLGNNFGLFDEYLYLGNRTSYCGFKDFKYSVGD